MLFFKVMVLFKKYIDEFVLNMNKNEENLMREILEAGGAKANGR